MKVFRTMIFYGFYPAFFVAKLWLTLLKHFVSGLYKTANTETKTVYTVYLA